MVFAFLCHSVAGSPCRILHSAVYGDDRSLEGTTLPSQRTARKEQLLQVACRVQSEYGFRMAAKDKVQRMRDDFSSSDEPQLEKGLFRLSLGDPFPVAKVVVWTVQDDCAYVLVCELDENRLLAESVLSLLTRLIHDHVTTMEQKNAEITLKAEKTAAILHQFLPNGQLLFMNHKVMAQYEKQLEKILATK